MSHSTPTIASRSAISPPGYAVIDPLAFAASQALDVETVRVEHAAAGVGGTDQDATLLGEEPSDVLPDRTEPLDGDSSACQIHPDAGGGDVDRHGEPPAGRADLVEGDAAERRRKPNGSTDLVVHPCHARLIRTHVGPRCVLAEIGDRLCERSDEPLLVGDRHGGVGGDHRLAATVAEPGGSVLDGHGSRQAEALFCRHVGGHAHAADRRARGDVVDHDRRSEAGAAFREVDDLDRAEIVAEAEGIGVHHVGASRSCLIAARNLAASPPITTR